MLLPWDGMDWLFRFSHTAVVRLEVLRQIFGWNRIASGTTFGRFFKSFSESRSHQFFIDLFSWFFEQLHFDNYTLDVDSSVLLQDMANNKAVRKVTIPLNEAGTAIIHYLLF